MPPPDFATGLLGKEADRINLRLAQIATTIGDLVAEQAALQQQLASVNALAAKGPPAGVGGPPA